MQLRSGSLGKRITAMSSSVETNEFETSSVQSQPINDTICCPRPSFERGPALLRATTRRLRVSSSSDDESDSIDIEEANRSRLNTSADSPKKKKFAYDICGKVFNSNSGISYHMDTHRETKPYKCDHCLKAFSTQNILNIHRKIHLPPEFKCNFCPKMFVQKQNRERHMNTHTGAKPFECEQCHKRFNHSIGLTQHREIHHSAERKHKCANCDKKFATSSDLAHHRKTHSAPKFECPFCQKKFNQSAHCRVHWKGDRKARIGCKVRLNQLAEQKSQ